MEYKGLANGMVDVAHKMCSKCNKTRPCFNFPGEKAKFCKDCKEDGMVDVLDRMCEKCNKIRPTFNISTETVPKFCKNCKTDDMVDICNKMCSVCNKKQPSYNKPGEKIALFCIDCKSRDMIDVRSKMCVTCNKKQPCFNISGKKAEYCFDCKTDKMIDVINKRCIECKDTRVDSKSKYGEYCLRCFIYLFPEKPIVRNYKTKEYAVVEFLQKIFKHYNIVYNKRLQDGVSRRVPDLVIYLENQIIIIEIDENMHRRYDCSCENKRLMELSLDVGHKSIVFIRFNPDAYFDKDNKKIKSCWSLTKKTGIMKIDNQNKWNARLNILKEEVKYWLKNSTNKMIEIVELFYDQNIIED